MTEDRSQRADAGHWMLDARCRMPRFECAEAERVLAWALSEKGRERRGAARLIFPSVEGWRFEKERDAFITMDQRGVEQVWAAENIMISDGSKMKVYPIVPDWRRRLVLGGGHCETVSGVAEL